jgi:hypothetical protein
MSLTRTMTRPRALAPGSRPHPKPWQPQPSRAAERAQDVGTVGLGRAQTMMSRQQSMELFAFRVNRETEKIAKANARCERLGQP